MIRRSNSCRTNPPTFVIEVNGDAHPATLSRQKDTEREPRHEVWQFAGINECATKVVMNTSQTATVVKRDVARWVALFLCCQYTKNLVFSERYRSECSLPATMSPTWLQRL